MRRCLLIGHFTDWISYIVTLDFSASQLGFFGFCSPCKFFVPVFPSRVRISYFKMTWIFSGLSVLVCYFLPVLSSFNPVHFS